MHPRRAVSGITTDTPGAAAPETGGAASVVTGGPGCVARCGKLDATPPAHVGTIRMARKEPLLQALKVIYVDIFWKRFLE